MLNDPQLTFRPSPQYEQAMGFAAHERPTRMEVQFRIKRAIRNRIAHDMNIMPALRKSTSDRSDPFPMSPPQSPYVFVTDQNSQSNLSRGIVPLCIASSIQLNQCLRLLPPTFRQISRG